MLCSIIFAADIPHESLSDDEEQPPHKKKPDCADSTGEPPGPE